LQKKSLSLPNKLKLNKYTEDLLTKMLFFSEDDRISWEDIFKHPAILQAQPVNQVKEMK
jgi:hypothetical protein